jgi:hypothetical protein
MSKSEKNEEPRNQLFPRSDGSQKGRGRSSKTSLSQDGEQHYEEGKDEEAGT